MCGCHVIISLKFYLVPHAGDFDLLGYEVFGGNNVMLDITEQTRGKPSLETFTLNWDGIASKPLSPESSEAEVCSRKKHSTMYFFWIFHSSHWLFIHKREKTLLRGISDNQH